jgi:integrase
MEEKMNENHITSTSQDHALATVDDPLGEAVEAWAYARTDSGSLRRRDLLRDKQRAVNDFFTFVGVDHPKDVRPGDVKAWQAQLEARGLAPNTIYGRISQVSSFYEWAIKGGMLRDNPVKYARPKAPKRYQTESTQSLTNEQVRALLTVVKGKANEGNIVAKRDYAMLLFYLLTGMRRAEVARLRWGDIYEQEDHLVVTYRVKGGEIENRELYEPAVKEALLDYLQSADRLEGMQPTTPLWTSHDRVNKNPGAPLTSYAFVVRLKKYAKEAGIGHIHLHQTRHTVARIVAEKEGIKAAQEQLGHKNENTTRVYVQRIGVRRDRFSEHLADEFGIKA